jgi:hypothetical protein
MTAPLDAIFTFAQAKPAHMWAGFNLSSQPPEDCDAAIASHRSSL